MTRIFHVYGTRNMHFTAGTTLAFFEIFLCSINCNKYNNFSTIGRKHECVQWNPKGINICFQFHDFHFSLTTDLNFLIDVYILFQWNFFNIFSEHIVSFKPTRKRPPLICLYCPKHLSKGSLWKRAISMKSYLWSKKSSLKLAWNLKVRIRAVAVDREKVNCSNDGTHSLHQFSVQTASAQQNSGFPSSFLAAWPKILFENLNFRIGNNPPCVEKFQKFCLNFFSGK